MEFTYSKASCDLTNQLRPYADNLILRIPWSFKSEQMEFKCIYYIKLFTMFNGRGMLQEGEC